MGSDSSDNKSAVKAQCLCPPFFCFAFDNFLRRFVQNPERILKPYIKSGWTVLDVGPGMGYFSIPMAKMVGVGGKVIAADLQKEMLAALQKRAIKAGVDDRIKMHQSSTDKIGVKDPLDFCLAFWMVHEVKDRAGFINEISGLLKKDGLFLIAEPLGHVSRASFSATVELAERTGLKVIARPRIFLSSAVLLKR